MGSRKTWIRERIKCDVGKLFEDLHTLTEEMKNQYEKATKKKGRIKCWENTNEVRVEHKDRGKELFFQHVVEEEIIQVHENSERICVITTRWDKKSSQCRLVITPTDEDPVEFDHEQLWLVMAYILEPFFFPPKKSQNQIHNPFTTE